MATYFEEVCKYAIENLHATDIIFKRREYPKARVFGEWDEIKHLGVITLDKMQEIVPLNRVIKVDKYKCNLLNYPVCGETTVLVKPMYEIEPDPYTLKNVIPNILNTKGVSCICSKTRGGKSVLLSQCVSQYVKENKHHVIVLSREDNLYGNINTLNEGFIDHIIIGRDVISFEEAVKLVHSLSADIVFIDDCYFSDIDEVFKLYDFGIKVVVALSANSVIDCVNLLSTNCRYINNIKFSSIVVTKIVYDTLNTEPERIYEIFLLDNKSINMLDKSSITGLMKTGLGLGMETFDNSLMRLRNEGKISQEKFKQIIQEWL